VYYTQIFIKSQNNNKKRERKYMYIIYNLVTSPNGYIFWGGSQTLVGHQ